MWSLTPGLAASSNLDKRFADGHGEQSMVVSTLVMLLVAAALVGKREVCEQ